jgi:thiol peroxidase
LKIIVNNSEIELQKRERKVGSEAPAVRLKVESGETKVVGMMADKVQVMITLPKTDSLNSQLLEVIEKHKAKSLIYVVASSALENGYDSDFYSTEFKDFAMKFGVYVNDEVCAKSIFIINKDGEIVYREIIGNLDDGFDTESFESALDEAIKFKKKGHTHENWMSV